MIRELCIKHTLLNSSEIARIIDISKSLGLMADFYESDVFIDVLSKTHNEAIVLAHGKHKNKSLYKGNVIGSKALESYEPGVLRTLKTGEPSKDIRALTQEHKFVKQNIHPIIFNSKVIAVFIVEKDISDELKDSFEINSKENKKVTQTDSLIDLINENSLLVDNLYSAILGFDSNGIVKIKNKIADKIYSLLGYDKDLYDEHYDNLPLKIECFNDVINSSVINRDFVEVKLNDYYFKVKIILTNKSNIKVIIIIQDLTEIKRKESELILKSVAVREANHRVKNNLQTVAAFLRRQSRRCKDAEGKYYLDESINRILAIASTHDLLSKTVSDNISILEAISHLIKNFKEGYHFNKNIDIYIGGDDFEIHGDKATAIFLVINELVQNCYEHAFEGRENGTIQIITQCEESFNTITVIDDGVGFDIKTIGNDTLGVSIVNSYIKEVLNGDIEISSNNTGTKILLKFENR